MRWPWRQDRSAEDRAKRVAHSYRHLVLRIARGGVADPLVVLAALDDQWCSLGANWVRPSEQPLDLDAWLSAGELAGVLGIESRRLRDWARRGHIRCQNYGSIRRYSVADVVNYQRKRCGVLG